MRIVHVNSDDGIGGAARAAMRLHLGLRGLNIDSYLNVQKKSCDLESVIGPKPFLGYWQGELRPHLDALPVCRYPGRTGAIFSPAALPGPWWRRVTHHRPDLVNLHWICNGHVRLESLRRINCPIVWTLHDSWAFTGGCHLPGECKKYGNNCGECPVLGSSSATDLSRKVWERKKKIYADLDLTIVTPSRWLADCARNSSLLGQSRVEVIPNGLDIEKFKPVNKDEARSLLGLPQEGRMALFLGGSDSDKNKGKDLLLEVLTSSSFQVDDDCGLLVAGTSMVQDFTVIGLRAHGLGRLSDEISLRLAYCAADLLLLPSREENLPYSVMEAMACGIPCVAFDTGGLSDLVDHGENGYLANRFKTDEFAAYVSKLLNDESLRSVMADRSRKKIVAGFSEQDVAGRYQDLYCSLVR